jgi:hypothetical protein
MTAIADAGPVARDARGRVAPAAALAVPAAGLGVLADPSFAG